MDQVDTYRETALFEHRFWLQILGDHARFISLGLAPTEVVEIQRANRFISLCDTLLQKARNTDAGLDLPRLNQSAYRIAEQIREYKLHLLHRQLQGDIDIQLAPTFLNHTVNEVEEYLRILPFLLQEQTPPPVHPVHHHLLWLLDAAGHAAIINGSLDPVEKDLMKRTDQFTMEFEAYYLKAIEVAGYLRSRFEQFPALQRFHRQVELEMCMFREFLAELEELELSGQVLGTLTPLLPDHMAREECYYLLKLAQVSDIQKPACDPTTPRTETKKKEM